LVAGDRADLYAIFQYGRLIGLGIGEVWQGNDGQRLM
jgi:hypothetical protein